MFDRLRDVANVIVGLVVREILAKISEFDFVHKKVISPATYIVVDIRLTLVAVILA